MAFIGIIPEPIRSEAKILFYSFLSTVAAAAAMAALNWVGAHIPDALQYAGTFAAGYAGGHLKA